MPPKYKFTREEIVNASLEITRAEGIRAVTARAVADQLGSSSKVIFGLFENMEQLQGEVLQAADRLYQRFQQAEMRDGQHPPYKASGMAYIRFAQEERELFKLLFMRDRSDEKITDNADEIRPLIRLIRKDTGLSEQEARLFHLEMWICVHGIATMIATNYLKWDWEMISRILTDSYEGLKTRYCKQEG